MRRTLTWTNLGDRLREHLAYPEAYDGGQLFKVFWEEFLDNGRLPDFGGIERLRVLMTRPAIQRALAGAPEGLAGNQNLYSLGPGGRRLSMRSIGRFLDPIAGGIQTDAIARCMMERGFEVWCRERAKSHERKFKSFIDGGWLRFEGAGRIEPAGSARRRRVLREVFARPGQGALRQKALRAYGYRCAISGADSEFVLEACHIRPVANRGDDSLANALLLRADLHLLFDAGLIAVDVTDYSIIVAPQIAGLEVGAGLRNALLRLPEVPEERPSPELLDAHRVECGL